MHALVSPQWFVAVPIHTDISYVFMFIFFMYACMCESPNNTFNALPVYAVYSITLKC